MYMQLRCMYYAHMHRLHYELMRPISSKLQNITDKTKQEF